MIFSIFDCRSALLKKGKKSKTNYNWFFINSGWWKNQERSRYTTQSFKSRKIFPKNIAHNYTYWASLVTN